MEITELEKSYIAGFFDGEGSVIVRMAHHKNGKLSYELNISIGQNTLDVLKFIQSKFGGRIANPNYGHIKQKHCPDLRMESIRASIFLETILPYLRIKNKQAELAIMFQKLLFPKWAKGLPKVKVTKENWESRQKYYEAVKFLNRPKFERLAEVEQFEN